MTKPTRILVANTLSFTVCFAVWLMYAVLIKYLTKAGLYDWSASEVGMLIGTPVLTGAVLRLPVGILSDRFGGKPVYFGVMLLAAAGVGTVSFVDSFTGFLVAGLLFGIAGASFAVGVAFTSVWYAPSKQGTVLGIFGAGNAGAAITLMLAPGLLKVLTDGGRNPEGWRQLPLVYAGVMLAVAVMFWLTTENKLPNSGVTKSLGERLAPLVKIQVWRFGFYYALVFGGFVGLSGWLVKYYVDVFGLSLATAGMLASVFSLPSGVVRAAGGWWSDRSGARTVMYAVLGTCIVGCCVLCFPVGAYTFTIVACIVGIAMGIGKAAVYKHIPTYFPNEVGVVGGMVGVLGGLGGFACPIIFGFLLDATASEANPAGLWTSSWMFLSGISVLCLLWMMKAIRTLDADVRSEVPEDAVPP